MLEPSWMIPGAELCPVHTRSATVVIKPARAVSLWNLEKISYRLAIRTWVVDAFDVCVIFNNENASFELLLS